MTSNHMNPTAAKAARQRHLRGRRSNRIGVTIYASERPVERVRQYVEQRLQDCGIPAKVNTFTGEITVDEGKLFIDVTHERTIYDWYREAPVIQGADHGCAVA